MESEFLTKGTLLSSDNYLIEFIMPATVSKAKAVRARVKVTGLGEGGTKLSYS